VAKPAVKRETKKVEKRRLRTVAPQTPTTMHELDRLIHERLRLGIISALAVNESLTFNELKHMVKTSDGNLSVHARKLEDGALSRSHGSCDWSNAKTGRLTKFFCGAALFGKALCLTS
jgi:hypothetical protein